ncbi:calcium-translocating P-type ATPase, PMCA-type [Legionella hackeliae]|uniref:P-type Ca(2+) transporter n=1 Tax=Legionella hackeliae TaxID=449 RepID=A0A0A8UT55_LEGHA|nr:calcium-translocating P-type ATPase, PMCA-type [Legionella hackeliae]KTD10456.1 cation transport ATPase [Legionella hackeliae]CEK09959.1 Calcium-transporting ATPase [Legionella hackeliae]STX49872.1 cation transport ATPase [Legionella hackeliae]
MQLNGKPDKDSDIGHNESWHTLEITAVAQYLNVNLSNGLTQREAARRLALIGFNRLKGKSSRAPVLLFLNQFKSALILILFGAAALAALVGNFKDAGVILVIVIINAFVGFYQEYRAEQSLAALRKMLPSRTNVRRDCKKYTIDAEEVVPGDIVLLEAGDKLPADGRLVLAANFDVDESSLTGESQPVSKQVNPMCATDLPVADRLNMAFMNTIVTRGRAELLVTATGMRTEMGKLSQQLASTLESLSPLQIQLEKLGKRLGGIALLLISLLFIFQLFQGVSLTHAIIDAIALAVAAMPEGLPVVVTVTLALGMYQMAKQRAIVKRLASVESLGCTTVICSDKTGTLTLNQMTVRELFYLGRLFKVTGEGYSTAGAVFQEKNNHLMPDMRPILVPLVSCNDSHVENGTVIGDPTEAALLIFAAKAGLPREPILAEYPRIAEIPFDSTYKFMATFHRLGENIRIFVKGAPDVLLTRCKHFINKDEQHDLLESRHKEEIEDQYRIMASRGLRCLLIASHTLDAKKFEVSDNLLIWINDLTFLGLIGLQDPPRPEAKQAISQCKAAGIAVKMITGDHQDTGVAIARELGLQGEAISGVEFDRLDEEQLAKIINGVAVFARVSPAHKVKIVQALQSQGHVVAMTGDGVNDAPALKIADIGVAMGVTGTAVAKEASAMVLTDDNFSTIVVAVKQGRVLYDNILKFIRFQLSTTMGAILTVFCAPFLGLPEPFNPIQILWVALIMDGPPAVSLALDAPRAGIMRDSPRHRSEPILPWSRIIRIFSFGLTMMIGTLGVLFYAVSNYSERSALTLTFTTFVLFQFFNIFNARVEKGSAFVKGFFKNRMLWLSLTAVVILQILVVHWTLAQSIFGTTHLTLAQWAMAIGVASTILIFDESRKGVVRWFVKSGQ